MLTMSREIKVTCLQSCPKATLKEASDETVRLAEKAMKDKPDILLLPEHCGGIKRCNGSFNSPHAKEKDHPVLSTLSSFASTNNIWIYIGSIAVSTTKKTYANRSFLLDNKGQVLSSHDNKHPNNLNFEASLKVSEESIKVRLGNQLSLAETPFGIFGLSVCHDLKYPDLYRKMSQAGAEILLVPAALTEQSRETNWCILNRARAIENGAFLIAPSAFGPIPGGGKCIGHTLIINPWGEIIADGRAGCDLVSSIIEITEVRKTRKRIPSLRHDRTFTSEIVDASQEFGG